MDDHFFTACLDNNTEAVQCILQVILEDPEITVRKVQTQKYLKNAYGHSVCLDVLAEDAQGKQFNIEIQKDPRNASLQRAFYNAAMIAASIFKKGQDYRRLPDVCVIFITETDVMGEGTAVSPVGFVNLKTGKPASLGFNIVFVNGLIQDETPVGKLMQDFQCADPLRMNYPALRKCVQKIKETKKESEDMRDLIQQYYGEYIEKARLEERKKARMKEEKQVRALLRLGTVSLEDAAKVFHISLEEVKKLKKQVDAEKTKSPLMS